MNAQVLKPTEFEETNIIPFKLNTSGTDDNWLSKVEPGTYFLARPKNDKNSLDLMLYGVVNHGQNISLLVLESPTGQVMRPHVDTLRFSRAMDLIEVIGKALPTEQQEPTNEPDAGTSDPV